MSRSPCGDCLDRRSPTRTGEGVRVTGIDYQRSRLTKRQGGAAPFHLGRRALALRQHAGNHRPRLQRHERQVTPIPSLVLRPRDMQRDAVDRWGGGKGQGEGGSLHRALIVVAPVPARSALALDRSPCAGVQRRVQIDQDINTVPVARFDGSSTRVMVTVLTAIATFGLALAACILLIAEDGYRWWRLPIPTTIPRDLPVVAETAQPVGRYADWFGPDDYPASAVRAEKEGAVRIALLIGADGAVEACEIVARSGTNSLDRGTCRAAVRHGRFIAARDAKGRAIPSRIELPRVRWVLPSDER